MDLLQIIFYVSIISLIIYTVDLYLDYRSLKYEFVTVLCKILSSTENDTKISRRDLKDMEELLTELWEEE